MAPVHADVLDSLLLRVDSLEAENRQLRQEVEALRAVWAERAEDDPVDYPSAEASPVQLLGVDSEFGYEILDPTSDINRKQRLILERKRDGTLAPDGLNLHGAITAVANFQTSNRDDKFGYLMRHPTSQNQVGDTVSRQRFTRCS